MKNPYIIPAAMICAAILAGFWMLKPPSEPQSEPQKVVIVNPPQRPDISIYDAAWGGNIEAVKQHLAAGTDVNAKGDDGRTPLHEAAWNGHKEVAALLIANGADVNAKDVDGETPVDFAEEVKDWHAPEDKAAKKATADLLRKHGGKTNKELKAEGK